MDIIDFFLSPRSIAQKQYEALRMFYVEDKTAKEVAEAFGYTHRGFTSIITDFKKKLRNNDGDDLFFKPVQKGRKTTEKVIGARDIVVELRKSYHSVEEIKVVFDSKFTNYQNLKKLDDDKIKFVTIRRRGKNIIDGLEQVPAKSKKAISEQIEFFHLNLVSSSMVTRVDFDLTISILTHNLFRLFALDLERYSHISDQSLFDKFLLNTADIEIENDKIKVFLKKKSL